MKFKTGFLVGAALGYYYGAKAGRERYQQIDRALSRVRQHPAYRSAAETVGGRLEQVQGQVRERVGSVAGDALSSVRPSRPEPEWEPGLEFNPDYRPSEEDLLADFRGESLPPTT
jgi:hypothetical protein